MFDHIKILLMNWQNCLGLMCKIVSFFFLPHCIFFHNIQTTQFPEIWWEIWKIKNLCEKVFRNVSGPWLLTKPSIIQRCNLTKNLNAVIIIFWKGQLMVFCSLTTWNQGHDFYLKKTYHFSVYNIDVKLFLSPAHHKASGMGTRHSGLWMLINKRHSTDPVKTSLVRFIMALFKVKSILLWWNYCE